MTTPPNTFGLNSDTKARLLNRVGQQIANRPGRAEAEADDPASALAPRPGLGHADVLREIALIKRARDSLGLASPFFRVTDGHAGPWAEIDGRRVLNFSSYNYLGLNGDPRVTGAAKAAADYYGTSVSGSRITSGERPIHAEFEAEVAKIYKAEAAVAFVGGHATNVTVIAHLVGHGDAVIHDALAHNSIIQGAQLSSARRRSFVHNDLDDLDRVLGDIGDSAKRKLVVIEGCYGMDGDAPDLSKVLAVVKRHGAHLMIDEAHSLGVLGASGRGVAEHCGVDPRDVDVWMGTMSKTLASCGGYIAGKAEIVDNLRFTAPGFLYSVGLPAPATAAALEALRLMNAEPERVTRPHRNGRVFTDAAIEAGLDVGPTLGLAIIPVIIGSSLRTALVANRLWDEGVAVQTVLYPGVPERSARLRFFVTSEHDPEDLRRAVALTSQALGAVGPTQLADLAAKLMA